MPAPAKRANPPFAKGSLIWEKKGPLPVWAWALILLGLVLAVVMWRHNKAAAEAQTYTTGKDTPIPGSQAAPYIFVVPQVGQQPQKPTPNDMPKTRRRGPGPEWPPHPRPTPTPTPPPATTPPAPPGGGRDTPPAPPPAPTVPTEVIYTIKSGDTLSGIAARFGMSAQQLYSFGTNAANLEQYAQWHGKSSSEGGRWIWPGYNIGVPG